MAKKVNPVPEGYHTTTPALVCRGAARAIDFYKNAFGAEERMRFSGPDGSVMHAELKIGDSIVMLGEEAPDCGASPQKLGGTAVSFYVHVNDVEAAWKRATKAGGEVKSPLADMFWGDRCGQIRTASRLGLQERLPLAAVGRRPPRSDRSAERHARTGPRPLHGKTTDRGWSRSAPPAPVHALSGGLLIRSRPRQ